jgi:hypothetical protein
MLSLPLECENSSCLRLRYHPLLSHTTLLLGSRRKRLKNTTRSCFHEVALDSSELRRVYVNVILRLITELEREYDEEDMEGDYFPDWE